MQNAVGKHSSTLRTIILYTLIGTSAISLHSLMFQLRQPQNISKSTECLISRPFMKPDLDEL